MNIRTLTTVALTWAALSLATARAEKRAAIIEILERPAQPGLQPAKGTAPATTVNDPAEPPVKVEVSFTSDVYTTTGRVNNGTAVEVASGPKGTVLKLATSGGYSGTAQLNFKNSAPPMRFTMKLTRMPAADLQSLSLTSGRLTLPVGSVGTSTTTKYFDAKGKEQASSVAAAYTIQAKRGDNGEVDIDVRRGRGAALDKALRVSWQGNYGYSRRGGLGAVLIDK